MTTEPKCVPGCKIVGASKGIGGQTMPYEVHATTCPKAEAPKVDRRKVSGVWRCHSIGTGLPEPCYHNGYGCTNERREVQRSTGWSKDERGKPAPAPEPKQGSEEPIDWEAADQCAGVWKDEGGSEETLARAYLALRAALAEKEREIAELSALVPALATERAAREKEKAHFAEQWTMEEGRFLEMLHRAEKAEARVSDLERSIVDWETEPQYRVTNLNQLHRVAKDILAARAKQGESR